MRGHNDHLVGVAVLVLLVIIVGLAITALASRRHRRRIGLAAAWIVGGLVAIYAVARGVVEFFTINYNDPASYRDSWGGPSLVGVFLVHSGPGFLVLVAAGVFAWRKAAARRRTAPVRSPRQVTSSRGKG